MRGHFDQAPDVNPGRSGLPPPQAMFSFRPNLGRHLRTYPKEQGASKRSVAVYPPPNYSGETNRPLPDFLKSMRLWTGRAIVFPVRGAATIFGLNVR